MLAGVKVLDLSRILAAPFATQILGDMGATVYKIEHPHTGDDTREWGPPFTDDGHESAYFLSVNRNKHSVCINLKEKEGVEMVKGLARKCDVVVENFATGKMEEMGLGYEELARENKGIVMVSVSGYGSSGPYANRLAYDVMVAGVGGMMGITGTEQHPAKVGVALTDVCTGLYAHGAILAALLSRVRTGRGRRIEVSLLDTQVATLVNVASSYLLSHQIPHRMGTAHSSIVPYRAYEAKDGHVIVGALNNSQFERMCVTLCIPQISSDARFVTNAKRVENREELDGILQEKIKHESVEHWVRVFDEAKVPCGPINNMEQVFTDPHVLHRHLVQSLSHPSAGPISLLSPPVRFDGHLTEIERPPPLLGQHTDFVLSSELGLTPLDLSRLRERGVIR